MPTTSLTDGELASIAAVLVDQGVVLGGPLEADLITGGRSNLTYALSDGTARWVLRTPPRTGRTPSAHDVAREHRVTSALHAAGIPVPPAVALCEDESLIGGPFTVSGFIEGRTVQRRDELAELDPATIAATVDDLVDTLAALHAVDHEAVGLGGFGRPDGYAARQLRRWSGQWDLVGEESLTALATEVADDLRSRIPDQRGASVVHGDYRIDNTILEVGGNGPARVLAVVDWELSTIGDPVADVAMMCAYRHETFDLIVGAPSAWTSPLLPDEDALAAQYERASGRALESWPFHLALAYFKIGVIAAGIAHRKGSGSGSGPGFDTAGETVEVYLQLAADALRHSS